MAIFHPSGSATFSGNKYFHQTPLDFSLPSVFGADEKREVFPVRLWIFSIQIIYESCNCCNDCGDRNRWRQIYRQKTPQPRGKYQLMPELILKQIKYKKKKLYQYERNQNGYTIISTCVICIKELEFQIHLLEKEGQLLHIFTLKSSCKYMLRNKTQMSYANKFININATL